MKFTRTNPKLNLRIVRGTGALLIDEAGRSYIDFVCGRGTGNIGHCHPKLVDAICRQAGQLVHFTNEVRFPVQEEYVDRLGGILPEFDTVYLSNSGAEAVESAIKLARLSTGRPGIISFEGGFHGRSYAALSATWGEKIRAPFAPLVPGFELCPPSLEEVSRRVSSETAAIIIEPIQGAAGVVPFDRDFLDGLQRLARAQRSLLIFDECQCGFARTGHYFAFQGVGVVPDILVASKSICGGVPAGATFSKDLDFPEDMHGGTFCGNPLACAAGLAVLEVLEQERILEQVVARGRVVAAFAAAAAEVAAVKDVRYRGLMIGLEFDRSAVDPTELISHCLEQGVLINIVQGRVVRILPALNIPIELLERGLRITLDGVRRLSEKGRSRVS